MKQLRCTFWCILFFASCKTKVKESAVANSDSMKLAQLDTTKFDKFEYQLELKELNHIKSLSAKLGLYNLVEQTEGYELRLWLFHAMMEPGLLYILKGKDSTATIFHYQIYCSHSTNADYLNPSIDSVAMESLKPQRESWSKYFQELQLDSLFYLKTQSEIKGKNFGMLDGHFYLLEVNDSGKYKYLRYSAPDHFQEKDINHKKFIRFKEKFVNPLIYNGMINP
jgi:hypothetical protein